MLVYYDSDTMGGCRYGAPDIGIVGSGWVMWWIGIMETVGLPVAV